MPSIVRQFQDLDLYMVPHPVSKDIIPLRNVDAVKRSVRNLILTNIYERPYQPNLGSGLAQLLFEPINPMIQHGIETACKDVIRNFEPRVTVLDVIATVSADQNGYSVVITFAIDKLSDIVTSTIFLERIR